MVNRIVLPVMMVVVPLPVSTDVLSLTIPCLHVADSGCGALGYRAKGRPCCRLNGKSVISMWNFYCSFWKWEGFSELKVLSFWLIGNFHYGFSFWGQRSDRNEQSSLGGACAFSQHTHSEFTGEGWKLGSLRDLNPHTGKQAKYTISRAFTLGPYWAYFCAKQFSLVFY